MGPIQAPKETIIPFYSAYKYVVYILIFTDDNVIFYIES